MYQDTRQAAPAAKSILYIAAAVTLIFLSSSVLYSQPRRQIRSEQLEPRQKALRNLEVSDERPPERTDEPLPAYEQSQQDFEQLQVLNNNLAEIASSNPLLDYRQIEKNVAEINKRAARLKTNLVFPVPEKDGKPKKGEQRLTAEAMKSAVDALNAFIKSFVENPVFQQLGVLDVEQSAKAMRDLEEIIRLSEQIQKRAGALIKAAGKQP